jgi:formylglycine-generating enzyme required for sulfatase activity
LSVTIVVGGGSGNPTPTGSVILTSGSYKSDAATLGSGNATVTLPAGSLAVGSDTLMASYTPDSNSSPIYSGATGTCSAITITEATATLSVTPSSSSVTTTQALTVTLAVSGGGGNPMPTGSVTLTSGGYTSPATSLSSGSATVSIPAGSLAVGSDTLIASYVPDSASFPIYSGATSTSSAVTVAKATPTVTVVPPSSSITTVQSLSVTIVVGGGSGNPTPTGSVILRSGSYTSAAATLGSGGTTVIISSGSLAVGSDTLMASYTPDPNDSAIYSSATGTSSVVTVAKATPTVAITSASSSITAAQALTVMVAVGGGTGNPTPTGSVILTSGSYTSAAAALSSGIAMVTIPAGSLAAGSDTLTAAYTPDMVGSATYNTASNSTAVTITPIGTATPVLTVAPSATTITNQQILNVTVSVAGGSGQARPAGTLALASGSYSSEQTLSSGTANFTIVAGTLSSGDNSLTATYWGDGVYASASGIAAVTVSQVVITVPAPPSASPGGGATATATLSAGNTYSGTMNLTCTLTGSPTGAQSLPTCRLNPASVTIASGGNGTTILTVDTTAGSTTALVRPLRRSLWGSGWGGALLAVVLIFRVPSRRRRRMWMLALIAVSVAACTTGCGGGGGQSTGPSTPATTAGSYIFNVIGTDSANANITASTNVTITVQ